MQLRRFTGQLHCSRYIKALLTSKSALILPILVLLISTQVSAQEMPSVTSQRWTDKFDGHFRKYSKRYFGVGFDWNWFKAQGIAESNLRNEAKSWVGAKGIMQIMPRTFEEIQSKNPEIASISEPRWNIAAGIFYNSSLYSRWDDIPDHKERMKFTFASYNAGRRTILKAQEVSRNAGLTGLKWSEIESVANKTKRWRHSETRGYVKKILALMGMQ